LCSSQILKFSSLWFDMMVGVKAAVALAFLGSVQGARMARKRVACGAKGGISARNGTGIAIVNGEEASECEWKWQVGFNKKKGGTPYCGGTLIDAEWVFTAGHCGSKAGFNVDAGNHDTRNPSGQLQSREAIKVIVHPKYNPSTTNYDFALVKVDRPFDMTSCVGTACLPSGSDDDVKGGSTCWITGWGTLRSGGYQPNILQEGEVTTLTNRQCKKTSYEKSDITKMMLCAQGKSNGKIVDACQGDSGGPLVCQSGDSWTLYGATSWGMGCAGKKYPGIWSRVAKVTDWVDDVMAAN